MILTIRDTAIINKSYFSRGLITHGSTTPNLIRSTKGIFWAGVRARHLRGNVHLMRSSDDGFSWETVFRGDFPTGLGWGGEAPISPSERANGAFISLNLFEELNKIILWHSFDRSGTKNIWPFIFNAETGERDLEESPSNNTGYNINADQLAVKVAHNDNMVYVVYVQAGRIRVRTFFPNRITQPRTDTASPFTNVVSSFDAKARVDGLVDLVFATTSEGVQYARYDDLNQSFNSPVSIRPASSRTIKDLNIRRDGTGVLVAAWSEVEPFGVFPRYAISTNNGTSWQVNNISINAPFIDSLTNEPSARVSLIAGLEGFVLSYTEGGPVTNVRTLRNGVLGEPQAIAQRSNPGGGVVGASFFEPPAAKLLDLEDPGAGRVGFQVGEGNSVIGVDTRPVRFGQEPLTESAYPVIAPPLPPPPDEALGNQRLVKVRAVAGLSSSIDYYKEGLIGRHTRRHQAAFNRVANEIRLLKYEPKTAAETNDRAAYGAPQEYITKATITPMSYETPFAATQDDFTTFIERDARRLYLPPDMFLGRVFLLNKGNFLKRTVWTYFFDGNEYEITQVLPHFIGSQLTHYSANTYVIGVSNNPFTRKILPSES